ncbi:Uncharacterised protein [Mycobacteroides abscessus subsp. abscessus]|nr:Uncharacterised protein [Mycobacteroides abscessus]SKP55577.1 Uncharacterised protein [Mycobacteroides abscessus subsp. abscessus]CPR93889.1 Uncharacterised protein [Mycobacteroides abscessus]CPS58437.1 Uncharacterised protein [Mycobacteroides abscessus]CPU84610.1 Uncharacterised protein [Mycobacteroides abscessus]
MANVLDYERWTWSVESLGVGRARLSFNIEGGSEITDQNEIRKALKALRRQLKRAIADD